MHLNHNFAPKTGILFIFLIIVAIGIDYEIGSIGYAGLTQHEYSTLFSSLTLLLIYIIPGLLVFNWLRKRLAVAQIYLWTSFFAGAFFTGWLASIFNDLAAQGFKTLISNQTFVEQWEAALTGPVIEEILKIICVFLLIYLFNVSRIQVVFVIGIMVGFGFQVIEDISYVVLTASTNIQEIIPDTFNRLSGALASHWAYTGIIAVGLFSLISKHPIITKKVAWTWTLSPVLLHFIWNSPINDIQLANDIAPVSAILTALTCLLIIQVFLTLQAFIND